MRERLRLSLLRICQLLRKVNVLRMNTFLAIKEMLYCKKELRSNVGFMNKEFIWKKDNCFMKINFPDRPSLSYFRKLPIFVFLIWFQYAWVMVALIPSSLASLFFPFWLSLHHIYFHFRRRRSLCVSRTYLQLKCPPVSPQARPSFSSFSAQKVRRAQSTSAGYRKWGNEKPKEERNGGKWCRNCGE